jgi:hypothetical protein
MLHVEDFCYIWPTVFYGGMGHNIFAAAIIPGDKRIVRLLQDCIIKGEK